MRSFEIFDGDRYLYTVMPSENPRQAYREEQRRSRSARIRMVMIENGERTEVEGPSQPEPEEEEFEGYRDEE